jgi:hypothetical protein
VFLNPIGLLALAAVPAILAIYYFRRRFQPKTVSAIFLWQVRERVPAAGRRFEKLRSTPTMWLELLAAILLSLAAAGFRPWSAGTTTHFVAVLDGTISMNARSGESTARDAAAAVVADRIAQLPRRAAVTIVVTGSVPRVIAGPGAFPAEAAEKLRSYLPGQARHDAAPSVALAQQMAGGGRVLFVTNRFEPEAFPDSVEVVSVGRPADNLAITHAGRTQEQIFLTIASFARRPANSKLVVAVSARAADGKAVDANNPNDKILATRTIALDPGATQHFSVEIPAGTPTLRAALEADPALDALAADSVAFLAPPPVRSIAVASTLTDAAAKNLGIWSGEGSNRVDKWLSILANARAAASPAEAHLCVCEGTPAAAPAWSFCLETPGKERAELIGPFLKDKGHALMQGITLEGLIWSFDPRHALSGAPIVSAGNVVLLTEVRDGERRLFRANFDPQRSTLARSPDWPIFLCNLAEARRAALPGPLNTNLSAGEIFTYRSNEEARYEIEGPSGKRAMQAKSTLQIDELPEMGVYKVSRLRAQGAPEALAEFAVNLCDPRISDLRSLKSGERPSAAEQRAVVSEYAWIDVSLLLAALLCLCADWIFISGIRISGPRVAEQRGAGA